MPGPRGLLTRDEDSGGHTPPEHGGNLRLCLALFGGISLRTEHSEIVVNNRKAKALIGYLALSASLTETRERLAGLLWSEFEEAKARASLRQVIRMLRDTFDQARYRGFSTNRTEIALDPATLELDVWSVQSSVVDGRPHDLLLDRPRLTDTLLAGYDDLDPSFHTWLLVQRENIDQKLIRGLESALATTSSDYRDVRRVAEALIQLDPTHEGACRQLMRSHTDAGDMASALSAYKKLWDLLAEDHDMEPSAATQKLVADIKSGSYQPAPLHAASTVSASPRPDHAVPAAHSKSSNQPDKIASPKLILLVGSFDVEGIEEKHKHIGIGFRYDLVSRLFHFREWAVVDEATRPDVAQHASRVRPEYLITARLYEDGERLKVIVTLHSESTGFVVWSDRYDINLKGFFESQQQIIRSIAMAMNVHISAERLSRIAAAPDVSLDIYDRWLRGQMFIYQWRRDDRSRAASIFASIIEEAPNFAPAYSSLAQLENTDHIVFPGHFRTAARQQKAVSLGNAAVRLDPLDSRSHLCLGWAHAFGGQFELAEASFFHASQLNAADPWTQTSSAFGLACCDRLPEARQLARQALDFAPRPSPMQWSYQSKISFLCENFEKCRQAAERSGDAFGDLIAWRAAALAHAGQMAAATTDARYFLTSIRSNWYGKAAPSDEAITAWLLHCYPFRNPRARQRLRDGLAAAGVPIAAQI